MPQPEPWKSVKLSRPEHQAIILAVFAGMFAWVMQAALDYYFYAGRTYPEHLFINIPPRELYSRLTITSAFLLAGFISSRMVRRLEAATARARRLDRCVRSVRAVNQHITRENDVRLLCHKSCETLVRGLGYSWVEIVLGGETMARVDGADARHGIDAQAACEGPSHEISIRCANECLGELIVATDEKRRMDDEEQALLVEVAEDIAFAVRSIGMSERLDHQREELETILDSVPAYISYKDREGRYLRVNRAVASLAGVPAGRWTGKCLAEIIPGAVEADRALDMCVLETGEIRRTAIGTLDFAPGKRWVQTDRIPYKGGDGSTAGVISLSIDITDLMEAQRSLAIKDEQLRQSQKMEAVGHLAGGIAHDFNNLLTAISGYTELAREQASGDTGMLTLLQPIADAASRAAALTHQLLAFSRRQPLHLSAQDLSSVVDGMSGILRRLIGEDIELGTELADDLGRVEVDQSQIEQLILNLAVNARDAMPEGGRLCISTRTVKRPDASECRGGEGASREFVCLEVTDSGMGMDGRTMDRIFEPFFTTKEQGAGTGLGLSVVFGIVDQHGGTIEVSSEPRHGTTFEIYLPVTPGDRPEIDASGDKRSDAALDLSGVGGRILLVEDEEAVRGFAVRALQRSGYEVVEAQSAEDAMDILSRDQLGFGMVFSDIVLPGKSGIELAQEVAAHHPDARILLASGYPGQTRQAGAPPEIEFPFLGKPYSIRSLLESVRSVLSREN